MSVKYFIKGISLTLLLLAGMTSPAQNPLQRRISINQQNVTLERALKKISQEGNFNFSYNSDILPLDSIVSVSAQNQPVETVLKKIITTPGIQYKAHNSYIIISQNPQLARQERKKYKYTVTGYIQNGRTGEVIPFASIYEIRSENFILADASGHFTLNGTTDKDVIGLAISKKNFIDTVIIVKPLLTQQVSVELLPKADVIEPLPSETINLETERVEDIEIVNFFVPKTLQLHAENTEFYNKRYAQVSLLPLIGTNGRQSGSFTNNLSLNILAGYSNSLEGVEVGGLLNINRDKMAGLQIAGLGNVVGGKMYGLQFSGIFNTNLRSVYGLQVAGISNYAQDTVRGLQISGFNNMLVGRMKGAQISGFNNLATREFDGVQVAGFSNLAIQGVVRTQAGGFFNYAQKVTGLQAAGFANVGVKKMYGLQAAGFMNYGHKVNGAQVAGFMNIGTGDVNGLQVGFINFATRLKGVQIGFLNISDSVRGIPIGFFSYVHDGYHKLQISGNESILFQGSFKTGVPHFYNIFNGGAYVKGNESLWSFGYGAGTSYLLFKKLELNLDATANYLFKNFSIDHRNILGQIDFQAGWKFNKYLTVFAGPTLNMLYMENPDGEAPEAIQNFPSYVQDERSILNGDLRSWIGWKAGFRF